MFKVMHKRWVMRRLRGRGCLAVLILAGFISALTLWAILTHQPAPLDLEPPGWQKGEVRATRYTELTDAEPQKEGILLLEGHGKDRLTLRMFCAVESAAKVHPDLPVSVLMTSKVIKDTPLLQNLTKAYPNLRLLHLNAPRLFHQSPLQDWYTHRKWAESSWPLSHFNDALRWLLLWTYGGIYLDMDVVVLRPLSRLPNCAGRESDRWVAAGVLRFEPGHWVIGACLEEMAGNFDGSVWGASGPELITKVLKERWEWSRYVSEDMTLTRKLLGDPDVLVLHVWNLHLGPVPINLNETSAQPYAVAAFTRCPNTVAHAGGVM